MSMLRGAGEVSPISPSARASQHHGNGVVCRHIAAPALLGLIAGFAFAQPAFANTLVATGGRWTNPLYIGGVGQAQITLEDHGFIPAPPQNYMYGGKLSFHFIAPDGSSFADVQSIKMESDGLKTTTFFYEFTVPVPTLTASPQTLYTAEAWYINSAADEVKFTSPTRDVQVLWPSCTIAISSNNTKRTAKATITALTGRPSSTGTLDILSTNTSSGGVQHLTQQVTLDENGNASITSPVDNVVAGGDYKVTASFTSDNVAIDATGTKMRCNVEQSVHIDTPAPPQPKNDVYDEVDNGPGDQLDVLVNDVAAPGVTLKIVSVTQPAHGSVWIEDGGGSSVGDNYIAWGNNDGASGPYTDKFNYTVEDSLGRRATAQVTLNVACGFGTVDTTYATAQGQVLNVAAPGFAAHNRLCGKTAPAGSLYDPPKHGTLTLGNFTDPSKAGSFTYTPAADFVGVDDFDYTYDGGDPIGTVYIAVQSTAGAATTTSLASDKNPALVNQPIAFTATVSGGASPTGKVQFSDADTGAVLCASATLTSGKATCVENVFAAGTHNIVARFTGDANNKGSSATLSQIVGTKLPPTTTLTSSKNPSNFGDAVTLTASLSGGNSPTGTISFNEGSTVLCTTVLVGGTSATCAVPQAQLTLGTHNFTATYSGDANNAASVSATLAQIVAGTPITLTVGAYTIHNGDTVPSPTNGTDFGPTQLGKPISKIFTITNSGTEPIVISSITSSNPAFTIQGGIGTSPPGVNTAFTVTFSAATAGVFDSTITILTAKASTPTKLTKATLKFSNKTTQKLSTAADTSTSEFTFAIRANAAAPTTYTVTPSAGANGSISPNTPVAVSAGGTAAFTITAASGYEVMTPIGGTCSGIDFSGAEYRVGPINADCTVIASFRKSTFATTTSVTAAPNPAVAGQTITFTAVVSAVRDSQEATAVAAPASIQPQFVGSPPGVVTFREGSNDLATVVINAGAPAVFSTASLSPGTHTITAAYAGTIYDEIYLDSSGSVEVTVIAKPTEPAVPAPALSTWMLALLGAILAGMGLRSALRRNP